jgi:hypothetical protein
MSILTNLPVTAICGIPATITIDKAQFVTDFGIVDPFWSDINNWREIEFLYVDDTGPSQEERMTFATLTYTMNLKTNIWSGNMLCQKISISDGNNGFLIFARTNFPIPAEFDFAVRGGYPFVPPPPVYTTFSTSLKTSAVTLSNGDNTAESNDLTSLSSMTYNNALTPMYGKIYKEVKQDADMGLIVGLQRFGLRFFTGTPLTPSVKSTPIGSPTGYPDNQYSIYYTRASATVETAVSYPSTMATVIPFAIGQNLQNNDFMGIALDFTNGRKRFYFHINGVWFNSADPVAGTGYVDLDTIFPGIDYSYNMYMFVNNASFNFPPLSNLKYTIQTAPTYIPSGYSNF